MTFAAFEKRYKKASGRLKRSLRKLRSNLSKTLARINELRRVKKLPVRIFRVRLTEERLKDCVSLYAKIRGDSKLDIAKALEAMHVRDLLGARVVCNTVNDVEYVEESFRKDAVDGLQYVEPPTKKNWVRTPNAESGYRGIHIDVKWPEKRGFNYAELQLRTLLQDAWATLFHEDLYKAATEVLPSTFSAEAKALSELLHEIDLRAQTLVDDIESHRIQGEGRIRTIEAVTNSLFAIASFSGDRAPRYKSLHRRDRYVIAPEAIFDFWITGECRSKSRFRFPMAGDTDSKLCTVESVRRMSPKSVTLSPDEYRVVRPNHPNRRMMVEVPAAATRHDYRIVCRWTGVFDLPIEYVWCPWASLYPDAEVKYDLQLEFARRPREEPRLLLSREFKSITATFDAYNQGQGQSAKGRRDLTTGRYIYKFRPDPAHEDFLCLFRQ